MTKRLTQHNPMKFLELCEMFYLNPKKVRHIEVGFGDEREDNFIRFETVDDYRLSFPLKNKDIPL